MFTVKCIGSCDLSTDCNYHNIPEQHSCSFHDFFIISNENCIDEFLTLGLKLHKKIQSKKSSYPLFFIPLSSECLHSYMTSKVNIELQGAKFILLPDKGLTPLALFWIKNPSYLFVKNNIDKYVFNKKKYLECYVGDDFLNFEELMTNVKVVRASLTQREFLFLSCYYRNISALSISKLLNKNIKTIYYIKRKIERKIHIRLPKN